MNLRPREYEAEVPCDNSSQTKKISVFKLQVARNEDLRLGEVTHLF